ncbi:MAG: hypothetical protein NC904_08260 [Candidatus Omnitrophica bacterium]|nr:hypothetical protein [Candidatus Omnitrophota bacterium]
MLKAFFCGLRLIKIIGIIGIISLSLLLTFSDATEKEKAAPSLRTFDEDVARSRRKMRTYCAINQELITAKASDQTKQAEAVKFLKEAQELWSAVRQRYQDNPPIEYSRDTKFKARLAEISEVMDEMFAHLEAGRIKRSFQTCGFACGLFVNMHEENGLIYGLDQLFHLRKLIKTTETLNKNAGLDAVKKIIPALLQKRNEVFMTPCPWPDDVKKCQEYTTALKILSSELDNLTLAVNKGEDNEVSKILSDLPNLCNTAYTLSL